MLTLVPFIPLYLIQFLHKPHVLSECPNQTTPWLALLEHARTSYPGLGSLSSPPLEVATVQGEEKMIQGQLD